MTGYDGMVVMGRDSALRMVQSNSTEVGIGQATLVREDRGWAAKARTSTTLSRSHIYLCMDFAARGPDSGDDVCRG